jgi:hypothetical protein
MTRDDYDNLDLIHRALFDGIRSVIFKSFSIHTGAFSMNCELCGETKLMDGCFQVLEDVLLTTDCAWNIIFQMELPNKKDGKKPVEYDLGVSLIRDLKDLKRAIVTMSLISQEKYATHGFSFCPESDSETTIFTRINGNLEEIPSTKEDVAESILSFIATNVPTELCTMMPL